MLSHTPNVGGRGQASFSSLSSWTLDAFWSSWCYLSHSSGSNQPDLLDEVLPNHWKSHSFTYFLLLYLSSLLLYSSMWKCHILPNATMGEVLTGGKFKDSNRRVSLVYQIRVYSVTNPLYTQSHISQFLFHLSFASSILTICSGFGTAQLPLPSRYWKHSLPHITQE